MPEETKEHQTQRIQIKTKINLRATNKKHMKFQKKKFPPSTPCICVPL